MVLITGSFKMSHEDVMNQLKQIKQEEDKSWETDIYKRTVAKLLSIEKKATYGEFTGKKKKFDEIIDQEFANFMEK